MSDDVDVNLREQDFHNAVREYIIFMLLFILLYVSSYVTVCYFKRRADSDDMYAGEDDAVVYRVALWLCTFTLSVSAGAILLLPISIISNEVLLLYPKSYYVKWLNSSLIMSFWNNIFLVSNLCLFFFMPFAYFFTESEGFVGSRKGVWARVYESIVVLVLLSVLVLGLAWVISAIFDNDSHSKETLSDIWNIYLPYLYSCISFFGVIFLMLCTPVGFARMFTVMGELVVKPKFLKDIEVELLTKTLEEEDLRRKYRCIVNNVNRTNPLASNGHMTSDELQQQIHDNQQDKRELEKRRKVSPWRRNLGYPLVMLLILALTVLCVLMVAHNFFELLVGIKALPIGAKETVLGIASLSTLGSFGAALEIVLILYVMSASVVGFNSLPFCQKLTPVPKDTSMVKVIGNCIVLLILSSALPVMSRMLGITNFDLIGNFGGMDWLGRFDIIMLCNIVFAALTIFCLTTKVTGTVRKEIWDRLVGALMRDKRTWSINSNTSLNGGIKEE